MTAKNDSSGNDACRPWIYPAAGANASLAVLSAAAVGKISLHGIQFERSATLGDYFGRTNGREWIRIGDEIIEYTGLSGTGTATDPWVFSGLDRNDLTWGSEGSAHEIEASVQQCKAWQSINVRDIVDELLVTYAGVPSAYINTANWDDEQSRWLSNYNLTTILSEPEGVSTLIAELHEQCRFSIWWDEINQTIPLRAITPPFGNIETVLADAGEIIADSLKIKDISKDRVSQVWFYYGMENYTVDAKEAGNFRRLYIQADTDAEAAVQYGDSRIHEIRSRWMTTADNGAVSQTASRTLSTRRDIPRQISFSMDAKDAGGTITGDVREILADLIQDETGAALKTRVMIQSVKETIPGHRYDYVGITGISSGPFGFIGPNSLVDYTSEDAADQLSYAFVSNASGQYSNSDTGHKII